MSFDDLKIRDVSRLTGQWTPPISAMGGPPAHELYKDLVLNAGLQLFRDTKSTPWVVLRDGAQRRAFTVPSPELRSALDRFRMRRNLRPVPESDIQEFTRVVQARVSDPDVEIPLLRSPLIERTSIPDRKPAPPSPPSPVAPPPAVGEGLKDLHLTDQHDLDRRLPLFLDYGTPPRTRERVEDYSSGLTDPAFEVDTSISGGRSRSSSEERELPRFVHILRELIHDGGWMGTTRELSDLTGEDSFSLFDALLKYRSELENNNILLAVIEVGEGYRWLAVDRTKIHDGVGGPSASDRVLPAE